MRLAALLAFVPASTSAAPRFGGGPRHWREPATAANPNVPRWATTYDWEMTPDTGALRSPLCSAPSSARLRPLTGGSAGVQNFTNLAFGGSLIGLDWAWGNTSTPGLCTAHLPVLRSAVSAPFF